MHNIFKNQPESGSCNVGNQISRVKYLLNDPTNVKFIISNSLESSIY
jgi:hypothetical protein